MKKHLLMTLTAGLAVAILTGSTQAALPERGGMAASRPISQARQELIVDHILRELALNDSAKDAQVRPALESFFQAEVTFREANAPKIKELHEALVKAREAKDQTKIEQTLGQIQDLMKPLKQDRETLTKQLKTAGLTQEQIEKVHHMVMGLHFLDRIHMLVEKLGLTEDQKAKMKDIVETARADAQNTTTFAERRQIWDAALEKISKDVLTADQRTKLQELQKEHPAMTQPARPNK